MLHRLKCSLVHVQLTEHETMVSDVHYNVDHYLQYSEFTLKYSVKAYKNELESDEHIQTQKRLMNVNDHAFNVN
jgi:hypothetical protein